jgi:ATP-dependent DNA helicase RecG
MELNSNSLKSIPGLGPKRIELLNNLGIYSIQELLTHFPRAYKIVGPQKSIEELIENEIAVVEGTIIEKEFKRIGKKVLVKIRVKDSSGIIEGIWFNNPYINRKLYKGKEISLWGHIKRNGNINQIIQPEIISKKDLGKIIPIYPLTNGVSQKIMTKIVNEAIIMLKVKVETLPHNLIEDLSLLNLEQAIKGIHNPRDFAELEKAKVRLIAEEFYSYFYYNNKRADKPGIIISTEYDDFLKELPYSLTGEQREILEEIKTDFNSGRQMTRLLYGDVGSGKTIISILCLYMTVKSGYQGAMMAPTEILANQHYKKYKDIFEKLGIKTFLLTGSTKDKEAILNQISDNTPSVTFGTHALLVKDVKFNNIGLVITDEQHRFGVNQRGKFMEKGTNTHYLLMSATPIPRTLAMTLYGNMKISYLTEKLPGRLSTKTYVIKEELIERLSNFISKEIEKGRQIYIVCPIIFDEDEMYSIETVQDYFKSKFPYYKIKKLHGKMLEKEKEKTMDEFCDHKIDILISTTVIEVGIDVKNASIMVVYNGERFGLAQLHQLRGRIGRGEFQSYFIIISSYELERLKLLEGNDDGFKIAELDLKLRGPGEFLGVKQHGKTNFVTGMFNPSLELLTKIKNYAAN